MASTWSYKSQSSSYRGKLQCIFDQGKGNLVRVGGKIGRRGGLMVSALDSGASGPGSSPGRGQCVVFLGKTLYSHSASLHPGV